MAKDKVVDQQETIFNLDGEPFKKFEQAAQMRSLLSNAKQTKNAYRVELHDPKNEFAGFVVIMTESQAGVIDEQQGKVKNTHVNDKTAVAVDVEPLSDGPSSNVDHIYNVYHPALRTYFLHIPLFLIASVLVFFAIDVWMFILSALDFKGLPSFINPDFLLNATRLVGVCWVLWMLLGISINFYGTKLIIDSRGVTLSQGILSRNQINVRFSEIRSIGLRQGVFDRLLNIGILEFASSGTDDVDIRFINMPDPSGVKAKVEALIERHR